MGRRCEWARAARTSPRSRCLSIASVTVTSPTTQVHDQGHGHGSAARVRSQALPWAGRRSLRHGGPYTGGRYRAPAAPREAQCDPWTVAQGRRRFCPECRERRRHRGRRGAPARGTRTDRARTDRHIGRYNRRRRGQQRRAPVHGAGITRAAPLPSQPAGRGPARVGGGGKRSLGSIRGSVSLQVRPRGSL
jgi:hypothetical protein